MASHELSSLPSTDLKDPVEAGVEEVLGSEAAVLEQKVWRKLDRWLMPMAMMFYLLSFVDRSNIANAKVAGMQTSLKMTNYDYSIALTVTYIPYILAEFPSNILLKIVGPDLMLPGMIAMWGIVATLQGVVHNYSGLLACRFFLGLCEGGLFPGITLYLSFFYPRERLQIRVAAYFASASLSGAFSGLLAAGIVNMDGIGGRPGWAWIFILEGLFTTIFGVVCLFLLPRSPETARFLSSSERSYVLSRLKKDGAVSHDTEDDGFSWREVSKCFSSPHIWMLSVALFFMGTTLYGLAYFEPVIVQGLGYAGNHAQLMSAPPFAVAFVLSIITAFTSDRFGRRGLTAICFSILATIGFAMFYASDSHRVQYGSLFLTIPGVYGAAPALVTWITNNSAPHTRRATAVAIGFINSNAGGVLATWLFGTLSPAPEYKKATVICLAFSVGVVVLSAANWAYLANENRKKTAEREAGRTREEEHGLGDQSAWFVYNL
ncbi:MFS general substrate transporter [Coniophora puteana RWD-64-598 SS2]|uniref:MFS general substrate transporter n=1 Tax=Coniophora puteana (strain RWD-64-598) TaxID=741705 RepID=A0A5M3MF17_CONPW|nr:MFS general substrate transporter [Coniophora puteana RWD-64-598 SS2]EIW77869.1 MFS general substrate transporter [Coniophora puteana RWD-64-598 SS2]